MPFNLAQWTGIAVTVIVISGSDIDVAYAVPLGLLAGMVAMFFYSAAERRALLRDRYGDSAKRRSRQSR
jgi:hypothetical protein